MNLLREGAKLTELINILISMWVLKYEHYNFKRKSIRTLETNKIIMGAYLWGAARK